MNALLMILMLTGMSIFATVNTGVSAAYLRPQTFHVLTFLLGGRSLTPLPQRIALAGVMKGGTATAGAVYLVSDPGESDALFGLGTMLSLMCRKAFETGAVLGQGPAIYAVGAAEPGAGTAAAETITVTGTATADGNLVIRIAGRYLTIGVANGTVQNTTAAAIKSAIDAATQLMPITASVATNVVTCTHRTKGVNGNDVVYEVVQNVAGVTIALAQSVAGAGVVDLQTAFDNLLGQDFDAIAINNHAAADITEINAHVATAWGPAEKKWRWFVLGEAGSIATATALASAANHQAVLVFNCEGSRSLPGEIAAAGAVGLCSRTQPNANYNGLQLPLYPPTTALAFTGTEVETALGAGLTPLSPILDAQKRVIEGALVIERLITSKTTDGGVPFPVLRDVGVSRTGGYLARQLDIAYRARFGAAANPQGALDTDDQGALINDMCSDILYAAQDATIIRNVDNDVQKLVVERDPSVAGRRNVDIAYTVVSPLHQVAYVHRITI